MQCLYDLFNVNSQLFNGDLIGKEVTIISILPSLFLLETLKQHEQ